MNNRDVEKHSVNCYFCNELVDERLCIPADPYNNNDGGEVCNQCQKNPEIKFRKIVQFALSYLNSNLDHASEIVFDDPVLQDVQDEDALEQLIRQVRINVMAHADFGKCVKPERVEYIGVILIDGRFHFSALHHDFNTLSSALSEKVCKQYGSEQVDKKEIVQHLFDTGEWHYADCQVYYGMAQSAE